MKKQNLVPIPNPKMLHGGTLKDVIAIQVLNGFLSNTKFTASSSGLVMRAYNVADAMLKERFEREKPFAGYFCCRQPFFRNQRIDHFFINAQQFGHFFC